MARKAAKAAKKSTAKRGRPAQTEEQKAAKKAAKDAAAAAAAAPAEKNPTAATAEKKPPAAEKASRSDAPMNVDEQKLFLQHLVGPKGNNGIVAQKAALATANAELRNLYKKAKGDGFDKADFDLAIAIDTAEKEAKAKAKIARQLQIAKYCGKALGAQLDLFLEPDRTPASENAYEEGKIASMKSEPARPGYDPSTEQHREYMRGYHDAQAVMIKGGIKPLDDTPQGSQPIAQDEPAPPKPQAQPVPAPEPVPAEPEKPVEKPIEPVPQKVAAVAPAAAAPAPAPVSGMRMTRADYLREQELKRQEEAARIAKEAERTAIPQTNGAAPPAAAGAPAVVEEDDDETSMFRRRMPAGAA